MNDSLSLKTLSLTFIALIAFAANSLFCRLALVESSQGTAAADPTSFTIIRLCSGALALWLILNLRNKRTSKSTTQTTATTISAFSLFVYAVCFSFAYVQLETGTGALILFGSVQITMVAIAIFNGHRLKAAEFVGLCLAFLGLVYLMLPAVGTPSVTGFILMTLSGIAWGVYTLLGSRSNDGLTDTSLNFTKSLPMVALLGILVLVFQADSFSISVSGVVLALLSGIFASGAGYAIWYMALTGLNAIQAAVFMLLVPLIAAVAGIVFVGEAITLRFIIAAMAILGGVLLVIMTKRKT